MTDISQRDQMVGWCAGMLVYLIGDTIDPFDRKTLVLDILQRVRRADENAFNEAVEIMGRK